MRGPPAPKGKYVTVQDIAAQDFPGLGLIEPICRALGAENYTRPTPIQARAIPPLLSGQDLLGIAQTGTGKTAAFALPILQRLSGERERAGPRGTRALVLAPTRELAIQIAEAFRTYGRHLHLRYATVYGGVGQRPQSTKPVESTTPNRLSPGTPSLRGCCAPTARITTSYSAFNSS